MKLFLEVVTTVATCAAVWYARKIGNKQNEINERIGNLQDVVELYGQFYLETSTDPSIKPVASINLLNVGTRLIYLEKYIYNGKEYRLNGLVRPPVNLSITNNFYFVTLPMTDETHVSLEVEFRDIDARKWRSKIIADKKLGNFWNVETYPRELIK